MAKRTILIKHPKKLRVNMSISPDVLHNMTVSAEHMGCSRSELVEYAFLLWGSQNPDFVAKYWDESDSGKLLVIDDD